MATIHLALRHALDSEGRLRAVASFVLVALIAVYYILEQTPASPGPGEDAEPTA